MLTTLSNWLDHRTGFRKIKAALLIEEIPGGAKWRYVWGSCLAFVFTVQLITGLLLMTAYSPGDSTAWSSVYFIQYEMDFGWLIRGLHHFGSQVMVVLLALHMLQVVIAGAHLPPREINWWLGLALLGLVLALSLTGYLLPWDQKGYWATQVATNIAGNTPVIGGWLKKVIVGGPAYGHHTLTRFYALHVGILPPLVIALTGLHVYVFRRHGVTTPRHAEGEGWFWPDQAFRDMLMSLVIFAIMLGLVVWGHGHRIEPPTGSGQANFYDRLAHAGRAGLGANLDAPADPAKPYPARPEWYFLFLFQMLKYFEGPQEVIGTLVIPGGVLLLLAILPLLALGRKDPASWIRKIAHAIGVLVVVALLVGVGTLTFRALADDTADPYTRGLLRRVADMLIPAAGIVLLVQLALLAVAGRGAFRRAVSTTGGVLLTIQAVAVGAAAYFAYEGHLPRALGEFVAGKLLEEEKDTPKKLIDFQASREEATREGARAVALAGTGVPAHGAVQLLRRDPRTAGRALFQQHCAGCHSFKGEFTEGEFKAADLAGFGSEEWISGLLRDPAGPDYFGRTKLKAMSNWVASQKRKAQKDKAEAKRQAEEWPAIARWLAGHPRGLPKADDRSAFVQGFRAFESNCMECHTYEGQGGGSTPAPDLTGYGDADWMRFMVLAPDSPLRYGGRGLNAMPAFRDPDNASARLLLEEQLRLHRLKAEGDERNAKDRLERPPTPVSPLSDLERELIIRWILGDHRVIFGGDPIVVPPAP